MSQWARRVDCCGVYVGRWQRNTRTSCEACEATLKKRSTGGPIGQVCTGTPR